MNGKDIIKDCENALLDMYFLLRIAERAEDENWEKSKGDLQTMLNLSLGALEEAWADAKAKAAGVKTAPAFSETHKGLEMACKGVRNYGILFRFCKYIAAHGYEGGANAAFAEVCALSDTKARKEWVCGAYVRYIDKIGSGADDADLLAFLNGEEARK